MHADGFKIILKEFPEALNCVKPLCQKLRAILFPLRQGELDTGTPSSSAELYLKVIEAYDESLNTLICEDR